MPAKTLAEVPLLAEARPIPCRLSTSARRAGTGVDRPRDDVRGEPGGAGSPASGLMSNIYGTPTRTSSSWCWMRADTGDRPGCAGALKVGDFAGFKAGVENGHRLAAAPTSRRPIWNRQPPAGGRRDLLSRRRPDGAPRRERPALHAPRRHHDAIVVVVVQDRARDTRSCPSGSGWAAPSRSSNCCWSAAPRERRRGRAGPGRARWESGRAGRSSAPPRASRSALPITSSDEADMQIAAIRGVTRPSTARGTAMAL